MYLMVARSSTSHDVISWVTDEVDFAGTFFPGPGTPIDIAATILRTGLTVVNGVLGVPAYRIEYTGNAKGTDYDIRVDPSVVTASVVDQDYILFTFDLVDNKSYYLTGFIRAVSEDMSTHFLYRVEAYFISAGGTVTQVIDNSVTVVELDETDAQAKLFIEPNGSQIQVRWRAAPSMDLRFGGRVYISEGTF